MRWRIAAVMVCTGALCLAGWTCIYEPSTFAIKRYDVSISHWPREIDGIEVALLSDLHVGSPYFGVDKLRDVVRATNDAAPDIIVLAGDYVIDNVLGGTFVPPEDFAPILGELEAPLGVYAVLGNHDWWLGGARVEAALESAGIRVLQDEAVELGGFWLAGLGDWREAPPDIARALSFVVDRSPVVAVTHNPDAFPSIPSRISLTLAGHTHGGQVRFPWIGAPIVPSRYRERYARGHVVERGRHLFVTSGLGTSIVPLRFRVPPEIAVVRLFTDTDSLPLVSSR